VQQKTGAFQTADNLNIYTVQWQPDTKAKAVVLLSHGYGEHIGRYQHVAEALVNAGYKVYGLDHRGHGKSDGKRVQVTSFTHFMDDLKQFFDTIRSENNSDKIFMFGHSMGSVIALQFALKYQNSLAGLIITGTVVDLGSTASTLLRNFANLTYRVLPHAPIGAPLKVEKITNDKGMQQLWLADTLVFRGWAPVSIAKYMVDTGEVLQEDAKNLVLPMLIMHGESDQLAPISGSRIMVERVGSADKTLKTWANMQHEILNEVDRQAVINTIIEWLDKH
jgi:acylglycerol lipase